MSGETRPGLWLFPGDSVTWRLPAGSGLSLEGGYLVPLPAEQKDEVLEVAVHPVADGPDSGSPAGAGLLRKFTLSPDPGRWQDWASRLPASSQETGLTVTFRSVGSTQNQIFLTEPSFTRARRSEPRVIVLFLIDTLRADRVSSYGYDRKTTPKIDQFFQDGVLASRCFANATWTLPSHASLFTSTSVSRHGVGRYNEYLSSAFATLAGVLSAGGFRTLAVTGGGYVDPQFGFARGFDRYIVTDRPVGEAVSESLRLLDQYRDQPVFLFFHTYQVHNYVPDRDAALELFSDLGQLGPEWTKSITNSIAFGHSAFVRNRYDAALRTVDDAFGKLVEGLGQRNLLDRSAIVVTSDHGEDLFERKGREGLSEGYWGHTTPFLFEESLRVPLLARVPWIRPTRREIAENTSLLDVAPTVLEVAGLPLPRQFEGHSVLGNGRKPSAEESIVSEAPPYDALAARRADFKLIRRTGFRQYSFTDGSPLDLLPAEQCFDLRLDPQELNPLPCDDTRAEALKEATDRYVASSFPESLVLRVPPRGSDGGRERVLVKARGNSRPPLVLTFGLRPEDRPVRRGAVTACNVRPGDRAIWFGFRPAERSGSLQLEMKGLESPLDGNGRRIESGAVRTWSDLLWRGTSLSPGVLVFSTPPTGPAAEFSQRELPGPLLARLRSLGYLSAGHQRSEVEDTPVGKDGKETGGSGLKSGQIRILSADIADHE